MPGKKNVLRVDLGPSHFTPAQSKKRSSFLPALHWSDKYCYNVALLSDWSFVMRSAQVPLVAHRLGWPEDIHAPQRSKPKEA
jgi:hypothetical protein